VRRLQAAIEAGVDPVALVDAINVAHAERQAARSECEHLPESVQIDQAEVYANDRDWPWAEHLANAFTRLRTAPWPD
jgi:hypothetical protein